MLQSDHIKAITSINRQSQASVMLFRQKAQRGRVPQERGPCIFPRQLLRTAKPGFKHTDAQRSASDSSPLALRVQAHAEASTSAPATSTETLTGSASYDFDGIETCYYDYEYNSQICYLQAGTSGPPLVFIHGFGVGEHMRDCVCRPTPSLWMKTWPGCIGASHLSTLALSHYDRYQWLIICLYSSVGGYHFERAMPALAKHHRVYALDLLGQGGCHGQQQKLLSVHMPLAGCTRDV